MTNAYGCTDTSTIFVLGILGIGQVNTAGISISVYPNPATSELFIAAPIPVNVAVTDI